MGRGQKHVSQVYTAFVDHPEAKILIDTGMDLSLLPEQRVRAWMPQQSQDQRIDNALRALGVMPEDIDIIVNTHLHIDHCSYNRLFKKATWLIQKEEYIEAITRRGREESFGVPIY